MYCKGCENKLKYFRGAGHQKGWELLDSSASPNSTQLLKEGFLGVLLLVLFVFFYCPSWKFFCRRPWLLCVKYYKTKPFIILSVLRWSV